jgi:hypothetical protein
VLVILPQESAETSNTDSNRSDGVLYGFFPAGDSGAFWFEVLLLFNDPSQDSVAGRPHPQMPPGHLALFRHTNSPCKYKA